MLLKHSGQGYFCGTAQRVRTTNAAESAVGQTFWCGCVSGDLLKIVTMLLQMKEKEMSPFIADTETHCVSSL